ncbi:hypothetical protein HYH33_04900 [Clostridium botulinum]|nr:hypothetical protein [Clostridium botulinum]MBY6812933.1 hypothetical protein [Clostridium botulinum]MBY6818940.1 hypothetical protein [Clostridium botulinum]
MGLRKDDPVYYKVKLSELINKALDNGLTITGKHLSNGVMICFESDNGEMAGVKLTGEI